MKKITKFVMGLLLALVAGVSAQAAPTMPQTDGNTYYYITFKRSFIGDYLVLQDMGDDVTLRSKAIVWGSADQLWKVEAGTTADTYKITSKSGRTINFASNRFQASSTASVNIKLVAGADYYELQREDNTDKKAMNPFGGSTADKEIGEWNIGDAGNALQFATAKDLLDQKVAEVEVLITNALVGDKVGQISTTAKGKLETLIDEKKTATYTDDQAYGAAITAINGGVNIFNSSISIVTPTISTTDSEVWYYIQGTRPVNSYLTDKGENNQIKSENVIPDDTQLWKFVKEGTGFLMVNKSSGLYLNSDISGNLPTVSAKPTRTLKVRKRNQQSNGVYRLYIENAEGTTSFRLHAGAGGNNWGAMNWTGDENDNCSWEIIEYNTDAIKAFLMAEINKANALSSKLVTGTDFGQITAANKQILTDAIDAANTVYTNTTATETEINKAKSDLTQAINDVVVETNTEKLIATDNTKHRWYSIVSMTTADYAKGKAISSNGKAVGDKYTYETKDGSDAQLFRFERNTTDEKVKVINYLTGQMAADGAIADTGVEFWITPLGDKLSYTITAPGTSNIHAQAAGTVLVAYNAGIGSASAWKFEFVKETDKVFDNVANTEVSTLAITIADGIISVAGVESFEVYSIAGQRVNATQPLAKGVYIIKTALNTQKVIVK